MANERAPSSAKCLFCNKRTRLVENEKGKSTKKNFWICEQCAVKDRTQALHGIVMAETKSKTSEENNLKDSTSVLRTTIAKGSSTTVESKKQLGEEETEPASSGPCCCQACSERKQFDEAKQREVQEVQRYWFQVRHTLRQTYRECLQNYKGKTKIGQVYNLDTVEVWVERLAHRDPHQLYQRIESITREHIMEVRVMLLQLLVSPEKAGVPRDSTPSADGDSSTNMWPELARRFLAGFINQSYYFTETVQNILLFVKPLQEHLERFGMTWRNVSNGLFDEIIYLDQLIQSTLPSIFTSLGFRVEVTEISDGSIFLKGIHKTSNSAPYEDLLERFTTVLGVLTSDRKALEAGQERMKEYQAKQMVLYKEALKAKEEGLKKGLENFERQQRRWEEDLKKEELKTTNSDDEDCSAIVEMPECFMSNGANGNRSTLEDSASTTVCPRCDRKLCSCEHCKKSHLIACCLPSDFEFELTDYAFYLEKNLNVLSHPSCSDSEDSNSGADGCVSDKRPKMDNASKTCRFLRMYDDEHNVTRIEASFESGSTKSAVTQQRMMYDAAHGDWETKANPATLLYSDRWEELLLWKHPKKPASKGDEKKENAATTTPSQAASTAEGKTANDVGAITKPTEKATEKPSTAPKPKCETNETKVHSEKPCTPPRQRSPRPGDCPNATPTRTCQQYQQLSAEWLKDPKNAAYFKRLLTLADADGNTKHIDMFRDANLDPEMIKKARAMFLEAEKTNGTCQAHARGECQKSKTTPSAKSQPVRGDSLSADEDDDSWSDHSSVVSQKDKNCDCCYCEMFGHGKPCGRDEYPQIRDRLRQKLKKKESELPSKKAESVAGYRGYDSVDNLVEYITGAKKSEQKAAAAKKSKKAPTKTKKTDSSKKEKQNENGHSIASMPEENGCSAQTDEDNGPNVDTVEGVESEESHAMDDVSPESRPPSAECNGRLKDAKNRKRSNESDDVNIDEVFQPKDIDLNSTDLDEAEREIECFKRFVTMCQPRENRAKVNLNIGHLLRDKKAASEAASTAVV